MGGVYSPRHMTPWRRFRSLTAADRVVVAEAGALMAFTRIAMTVTSFPRVRRALAAYGRFAHQPTGGTPPETARISWAVSAAARHLPLQTTCLVESLTAEAMLVARGVPCVLRVGVRRPERARALDAHAWVESDGRIVAGAVDDLDEYAVLADSRDL